jgi:hypothetical protein
MKIKWGALVVDGRNKIGGQVASKNRAGAYMRNKVTPVNPKTSFQVTVRARLSGLASGWRGLTQAQRIAWNNAVSDYKKTDIFGDIQNPSGFNLYVKLNSNLINIGVAVILTTPLPVAVSVFTTGTLAAAAGAQTLSLAVTPAVQPVSETIIVRATPAMSAGKFFVKSEFRQIGTFTAATAGAYDLAALYIAKFGPIGPAGTKIFVEVTHVSETTGQQSQVQEFIAVVAA